MLYEYECVIRSITDGDGLKVDVLLGFGVVLRGNSGRGVCIRLYVIDAPESRTRNKQENAHGLLAKKFLQDNLKIGGTYILRTKERGKFGRWLGEIKTGKGLITRLLIKNKLAVEYHGENRKALKAAHEKNRQELIKQGLL